MGLNDFLPRVLEKAGVPVDLAQESFGGGGSSEEEALAKSHLPPPLNPKTSKKKSSLRLGIDVSSLLHKAAHGFGEMLGDERHLTNFGRSQLIHEQRQQNQHAENNSNASSSSSSAVIRDEVANQYVQRCASNVLERLQKIQSDTKAQILVVLDGQTPPMKQEVVQQRKQVRQDNEQQRDAPAVLQSPRAAQQAAMQRTKAMRRAGAGQLYPKIVQELCDLMRRSRISFLVAPYEADGQLAFLSQRNYIHIVITEDSDLIAHGAKSILYKSIQNHHRQSHNDDRENHQQKSSVTSGILLRPANLGTVSGSFDSSSFDLKDYSPVQFACLFVAAGSDYCDKLKGIGVVTAAQGVRAAFSQQEEPPLQRLFRLLYKHTTYPKSMLTEEFRKGYEQDFMRSLIMFRHPVVYDPISQKCIELCTENRQTADTGTDAEVIMGDPELISYPPYLALLSDPDQRAAIVGNLTSLDSASCTAMAEGRASWKEATVMSNEEVQDQGEAQTSSNEHTPASSPPKEQDGQDDSDDDDDAMQTQPMTQDDTTMLLNTQMDAPEGPSSPPASQDVLQTQVYNSPDVNTRSPAPSSSSKKTPSRQSQRRRKTPQSNTKTTPTAKSSSKKAGKSKISPTAFSSEKKRRAKRQKLDESSSQGERESSPSQLQAQDEFELETQNYEPLTSKVKINLRNNSSSSQKKKKANQSQLNHLGGHEESSSPERETETQESPSQLQTQAWT